MTLSRASLPSLGVSSLDLGRTGLRAAPFILRLLRLMWLAQCFAPSKSWVLQPKARPAACLLLRRNMGHSGSLPRCPLFGGGAALEQEGKRREHLDGHVRERAHELLEILALGEIGLVQIEAAIHLQL